MKYIRWLVLILALCLLPCALAEGTLELTESSDIVVNINEGRLSAYLGTNLLKKIDTDVCVLVLDKAAVDQKEDKETWIVSHVIEVPFGNNALSDREVIRKEHGFIAGKYTRVAVLVRKDDNWAKGWISPEKVNDADAPSVKVMESKKDLLSEVSVIVVNEGFSPTEQDAYAPTGFYFERPMKIKVDESSLDCNLICPIEYLGLFNIIVVKDPEKDELKVLAAEQIPEDLKIYSKDEQGNLKRRRRAEENEQSAAATTAPPMSPPGGAESGVPENIDRTTDGGAALGPTQAPTPVPTPVPTETPTSVPTETATNAVPFLDLTSEAGNPVESPSASPSEAAPTASTSPEPTPTPLREDETEKLQQMLKDKVQPDLAVDGEYGSKTQEAAKKAQQKVNELWGEGTVEVTGFIKVGDRTWNYLAGIEIPPTPVPTSTPTAPPDLNAGSVTTPTPTPVPEEPEKHLIPIFNGMEDGWIYLIIVLLAIAFALLCLGEMLVKPKEVSAGSDDTVRTDPTLRPNSNRTRR